MDDAEFQQLLNAPASGAPSTPAPGTTPPTTPIDAATFQRMLNGGQPQAPQGDPQQQPQPAPPVEHPDAIGEPSSFLDAAIGGGLRAINQTADFIAGPEAPGSDPIRDALETGTDAATKGSFYNETSASIAQFATGMLGAGKLASLAKLPEAASAIGGVAAHVLESGKAALTAAVAFDPHEDMLSGLVSAAPIIGPSVAGFLASNPDTPAWEGRLKNALESIGVDAALSGAFMAAGKVYRALSTADHATAAGATEELQGAQQAQPPAAAPAGATEAPQAGGPITAPDGSAPPSDSPAAPEGQSAAPSQAAAQEGVAGDSVSAPASAPATAPLTITAGDDFKPPEEPVPPVPTEAQAAKRPTNPAVTISTEDAESLVEKTRAVLDAADQAGGLSTAIEEGRVAPLTDGVPWTKLNAPDDVEHFIGIVADTIQGDLNDLKGGEVMTDAKVAQRVNGIASYFNLNPASVVGALQAAGENAPKMVAQMDAAYTISNRMFQESFALSNRIGLGDLTGFATRDAALTELERQATLAASMYASGESMKSNMARGLRRAAFSIDPDVVARIKAVGGDKLATLFANTLGDAGKLKKVVNPTFLQKAASDVGFMVQSNLLWNLGTFAVKSLSDGSMLLLRPTGRVIGGLVQGNTQQAAEAARQMAYYYLGLKDGLPSVINAFKTADSTLTPRHSGFNEGARVGPIAQAATSAEWKPFNSTYNISYNAYLAATRAVWGTTPRLMAAADEMAKQITYRSYVAAKAWTEGKTAGLSGDALSQFVTGKLSASIDNAGKATDAAAAQEAKVASFTQDLTGVQSNFGGPILSSTISSVVSAHPLLRLVLPFTHTPANIFRYAVKMTPVANMLQQEFRDMLFGRMGAEQQANAIGQFALGSAALGAIAASGLDITGGGPADPKVRGNLIDSGWRPYSLVWQSADGTKNYFPIGRVEPLALPFGIVADIMDYLHLGGDASKVQGLASTLLAGLVKQAANKTYLLGISHVVEAFDNPQQNLGAFTGKSLAELVPFASALRTWNPDPFMREARTMTDNLIANIPGLSATLPAKYDDLGQPVTRHSFISSSPPDAVTGELQRMEALGYTVTPATPTMKNADLRDVTTQDGKNAWEWYQQLAGQPTPSVPSLKAQVGKVISTDAYNKAPDGPGDVTGTKLWMLHTPIVEYRKAAEGLIQKDPNVRTALLAAQQKVVAAYHDQKAGVSQQTNNADALKSIVGHFTQYLTPPAPQTTAPPSSPATAAPQAPPSAPTPSSAAVPDALQEIIESRRRKSGPR